MPFPQRLWQPQRLALVCLPLGVVVCLAAFAFPPVRTAVQKWLARPEKAAAHVPTPRAVELIEDGHGHDGLRVSALAIANLEIQPVPAERAVRPRPLPPQVGTLNYDHEGLHVIRPRFPGELVELRRVSEGGHPPYGPASKRPLRFGDRVKQGDVLAVLWCKELGEKKAALVDALQNLRLSKDALQRQRQLFGEAALSLASLRAAERQFQIDSNAVRTAEWTLRIWKLSDPEIDAIKKEADALREPTQERDAAHDVNRWARVEVKVPQFQDDPQREFVVLEMNTNLGDFVDAGRDPPLFRLGDLRRLQIWVHPPLEIVPLVRERLHKGPLDALRWQIQLQAEPNQAPLDLPIAQLAPSLEPYQRTPMLIGYLDNPDLRYLVGQPVTATIFLPPPEDTVEIPTEALNQYEGQNLVIVQDPERPDEFFLRRVVLAASSGGTCLIRSRLTPEDDKLSQEEKARGRRPLEPLRPGERVITRGVVELTSALDELVTNRAAEALGRGG